MKTTLKIDPYHFPIIIIAAFVIGLTLAIALGFGPQHGNHEQKEQGDRMPAFVQTVSAHDVYNL
jgi:hypothetical protein